MSATVHATTTLVTLLNMYFAVCHVHLLRLLNVLLLLLNVMITAPSTSLKKS